MPAIMLKELEEVIEKGRLSPSLRLTRYADLGEKTNKKNPIDAICKAKAETATLPVAQPGEERLVMKVMGRLLVNHAGGVLENANLCLHRHFGYPYIPGSAVKGVARHAAWCSWREESDPQKKMETARAIAHIFGFPTLDAQPRKESDQTRDPLDYLDDFIVETMPDEFGPKGEYPEKAGSVVFLSALPRGPAPLVTDVLTCHHMKYYSGRQSQALDTENPNPQFFPAVEKGASFVFRIAPTARLRTAPNPAMSLALSFLKDGLTTYGVGAKTAAGYGWFEEDLQEAKQIHEEAEAERQKVEEQQRRATLDPIEVAMEDLRGLDLGEAANDCTHWDEPRQRALLRLLSNQELATWKDWIKRAKKKEKVKARLTKLRDLAEKLGEDVP